MFGEYHNNERYPESLDNLTPADLWFGSAEEGKIIREEIKQGNLKNTADRTCGSKSGKIPTRSSLNNLHKEVFGYVQSFLKTFIHYNSWYCISFDGISATIVARSAAFSYNHPAIFT